MGAVEVEAFLSDLAVTGGVAAGVLGPLIEAGPAHITLANRSADKATALAARHRARAAQHGVTLKAGALTGTEGTYDVVINATASSLGGAEVPVPGSVLVPGALALDMMYGPAAHGFMAWAAQHGATTGAEAATAAGVAVDAVVSGAEAAATGATGADAGVVGVDAAVIITTPNRTG